MDDAEAKKKAKAKIVEAVGFGVSHRLACRTARVGRSTFYRWRKEDPDFDADISGAEGDGVLHAAKEVRTTTDPVRLRAALSFLWSHDTKRWRQKQDVRLSGGVGVKGTGLADLLAASARAAAAKAADAPPPT